MAWSRRLASWESTEDDRAALLGGLLALADMLHGEGGENLREIWRRRGKRAFEAEAQGAASSLPAATSAEGVDSTP